MIIYTVSPEILELEGIVGDLEVEKKNIKLNTRQTNRKKRIEEIELEIAWHNSKKKVLELKLHSKNDVSRELQLQRAEGESKIAELKYALCKERQEAMPDQSQIAAMERELQKQESANAP